LYKLGEQNAYLVPGMKAPALDEEKLWDFTPSVAVGDKVKGGDAIRYVPEGRLTHSILVPFNFANAKWKALLKKRGKYYRNSCCYVRQSDTKHEF